MTDIEIKEKVENLKKKTTNTINFIKTNKISIFIRLILILIVVCGIFLGGFFTARKLYKVENTDQQVQSLQFKLNEATSKLNDLQSGYDDLILLNEEISNQSILVKKEIEESLRIVKTSQTTIDEIKDLTVLGNSNITSIENLINAIKQNNVVIKDKVIILESNLKDLEEKLSK